jgi:hypothetical protein
MEPQAAAILIELPDVGKALKHKRRKHKKHKDDDEEEDADKKGTWERLKMKLLQTLPQFRQVDLEDLQVKGFNYFLAISHLLLYIATLGYFVINGTFATYQNKFLSLTKSESSVCSSIPLSVTGSYSVDADGHWSSRSQYARNKSVYHLAMEGTTVTTEGFSKSVSMLSSRVLEAGNKAVGDPFGALIGWILFFTEDIETRITLKTTAELSNVFSKFGIWATYITLASQNGVCTPPPTQRLSSTYTYAPGGGYPPRITLNLPFDAKTITNPPAALSPCPDQININAPVQDTSYTGSFLYGTYSDSLPSLSSTGKPLTTTGVQLFFDVQQLAVSFAFNFGLVREEDMTTTGLPSPPTFWPSDVPRPFVKTYVSRKYPDNGKVFCYSSSGRPRVCAANGLTSNPNDLTTTSGLVYPVFFSVSSADPAAACSCPSGPLSDHSCYDSAGVVAALFFVGSGTSDAEGKGKYNFLDFAWKLQQKIQKIGASAVKQQLGNLVFTARAMRSGGSWDDAPMTEADFTAQMASLGSDIRFISFELDTVSNEGLIGAAFNDGGMSLEQLPNYYQYDWEKESQTLQTLPPGQVTTCNNTLYQPRTLQLMQQSPPVVVVQPYLSCHFTLSHSIVEAMGVAAGNAAIVSSVFLTVCLSIIIAYVNKMHKDWKIIPPAEKTKLATAAIEHDRLENKKMAARVEMLETQLAALLHERVPPPQQLHPIHMAPPPLPSPPPFTSPSPPSRTSFGLPPHAHEYQDNPMFRGSLSSRESLQGGRPLPPQPPVQPTPPHRLSRGPVVE